MTAMTFVLLLHVFSPAQTAPPDVATASTADDDELKPTEIGVRFTPELSAAMTKKFVEQMKPRYELSDQQAADISKIMNRNFLKFAHDNSENTRDMIELMMANMLEHDGHFDVEAGKRFAKLSKPLTSNLKQFFTDSAGEIGKQMTIKQKLKFTADAGMAAAGLLIFEKRMDRWSEGKLGDFANPFFEPGETDKGEPAPATPADPNESTEHRKVRQRVEQYITWQIDMDSKWDHYVERAIAYYKLDEKQTTAAKAVLKDCKDRVKPIKTPQWKAAIKENRIIEQLSWQSKNGLAEGPFHYAIESEFKRMMQPMNDLEAELKKRIESLPTSSQRAAAKANAEQELAGNGLKQIEIRSAQKR